MTSGSLRLFRFALWGLVLAAGLGGSWLFLTQKPPQPGVVRSQLIGPTDIGQGDYQLVTHDGKPFTAETLRGGYSLVFFGFTHCPDVCPTTLGDIEGWRETLGPAAEALRVYFVTVDPERDTAEVLRDYVSWLPGALGVTGSLEEVVKTAAAFRVYRAKVPLENGDYTMDHTAYVMLFNPAGEFERHFNYQADPAVVVEKLREALKS